MIFEIVVGSIILGSFIYHRWIEDKPPGPRARDITLPRVDEGSPIPLLYGRCLVRAPIVAWTGNHRIPTEPGEVFSLDILFVIGIPFFGGSATVPIGFVYAGDIQLPSFVLLEGESGFNLPGEARFAFVTARAGDGRFQGQGEFYGGSPTQNLGAPGTFSRAAMVASGIPEALVPGFRNQVCVAFAFPGSGVGGLLLGPSPDIPSFSFEVISLSTGTVADMGQSLDDEADPAAVLYDLLTSPWGKLGLPESRIDRASFELASATLFAEGHGYSRAFDTATDASEDIADILKQTDGLIYEEPTTGKIVYKLARADFVVGDLTDINPSNASLSNYMVQGWNETANHVNLTFTDRIANYADGLAIGSNEANAVAQEGRRRPIDIHYPGCCSRSLAQQLASRELAVVSRPQVKVTVVVNRSFHAARPLSVYTFTWPELGIDHMVMRVARVDLGQLHDGRITLDMIRDVFDVSIGAYPVPD